MGINNKNNLEVAIGIKDKTLPLPGNQYLKARYNWIPEHGYVLLISTQRLKELESDLAVQSTCSQAVPKIPTALRKRRMLCFISARKGVITHVARSVVYYAAESGKDKLELWNVMPFAKPVRFAAIKAKLEGKQAWRAKQALIGGHISAAAFDLVMKALKHTDAGAFEIADGLIDHQSSPPDPTPTPIKTNWAYQRDAVVTSLEIARIPKEQLNIPPQLEGDTVPDMSSIFDDDGDVSSIEDFGLLPVFRTLG